MREEMILDLARSGIPESELERGKFKAVSGTEIRVATGSGCGAHGYEIPYFSIDGEELDYLRFRTFSKIKGERYKAINGSQHHIYFPPSWADSAYDVLVITEGEKKAYKGCLAGIPTLGLAGVDMWHDPKYAGPRAPEKPLHPELISAILYKSWRRIVVVADSDASQNKQVLNALKMLARAIRMQCRIKAEFVVIPTPDESVKRGLDDFLVEGGDYVSLLSQASIPDPEGRPEIRHWIPYDNSEEGYLHFRLPYVYGDEVVLPKAVEERIEEKREKEGGTTREKKVKPINAPCAWYDMTYLVMHTRDGVAVTDDPSLPVAEMDVLRGVSNAREFKTFSLPRLQAQEAMEELGITGDVKQLKRVVAAQKLMQPKLVKGVRNPGWVTVGNDTYYVAPGMSIKANPEAPHCEYIPSLDAIAERPEAAFLCGGDKRIHQEVARDLLSNQGVASAVAFAYAGALLQPLKNSGHYPEIGILHLGGSNSSGRGKTSILRTIGGLAGSAASPGVAGTLIKGWNTTENGLEAPLAAANDSFVMLDELGQASARTEWRQLLYMAANGTGKNRMTKTIAARKSLRWSRAIISTGEMGLYEKLDGLETPEGILFRVIEYDYQPEAVWDKYIQKSEGKSSAVAKLIDNSLAKLQENYGYTYHDYINYIIKNRQLLSDFYAEQLQMLDATIPDVATSAYRRRAKTMALVITSGFILSEILQDTQILAGVTQFCVLTLWSAGMRDITKSEPDRAAEAVESWLASSIGNIQEGRVSGLFFNKSGELAITAAGVGDISRRTGLEQASVRSGLKALHFAYKTVKVPQIEKRIKAYQSDTPWLTADIVDDVPF